MNIIQSLIAFLGRALLSITFICSGMYSLLGWQCSQQYFNQGLTDWLALSVGNPTLQNAIEFGLSNASVLLLIGVIFEIVGGLLVFFGLFARLGALLLIIFLIPTTLVFHHFWQIQGGDRDVQMVNFMKNVSILGGLLFLLALGKGSKRIKTHDQEE
jgi:putative oxidoreductase